MEWSAMMAVELFFAGFDGVGVDGRPGKFDGKALIARTGPDYRPAGWVLVRAKATRQGNHCELAEDCEPDLEGFIRKHPAWVKQVEEDLAKLEGRAS
jgi:hypothetical protein